MTASVTLAHSGSEHPGRVLEIPRCALLSLNGPRRGEEVIIERECFRIGKSPENDLVLADETVSREHCEIVRDDKGYLLRDLGSTNGTLLDGAEIREGYLRAGVVIRVGRIDLKVRPFAERIETYWQIAAGDAAKATAEVRPDNVVAFGDLRAPRAS